MINQLGRSTALSKDQTVASYLASTLPDLGITHVFELVGGMVTVLLDAMHQNPRLTVVSVHHEQGAGFAAEGFARVAGRPAVALATSGPGATNLLTAVGSCYFDSVPVVYITGQVNRHELRQDGRGRQGGFQETDIVAMAKPVTKWSKMVTDPASFTHDLDDAVRIATSGRPGPVLLDIPMDIQQALVPDGSGPAGATSSPVATDAERTSFLARFSASLDAAERPLILAGGGIRAAGVVDDFRAFAAACGVPVAASLMGVDAVPTASPLHAGFFGSYGNRWANWAISAADILLVLGSRLDVRQTGSDIDGFRGDRHVFHVDIDDGELNNRVQGCDVLHDDLADFLPRARAALGPTSRTRDTWLSEIADRRRMWPDTAENVPAEGINPNAAVRQICEAWADVSSFVTDVGQHQMWAAQSVQLEQSQRFLTSGGMGSMGFGLPTAIGAALASAPGPVALIAGDGGVQCNIQELQTLSHLGLPVRVVVFDNRCHGMVRQFQQSYFDSRYYSTKWGYSAPEFCAIAGAYGIRAWHAASHDDLAVALKEAAAHGREPALLHVEINEDLNAYPKMAFGRAFGSMEPAVTPTEMEGT